MDGPSTVFVRHLTESSMASKKSQPSLLAALFTEADHVDVSRRRDVVARAQIAQRPEHVQERMHL